MKIVGISKTEFQSKAGNKISGSTIYTTEPMDPKRGQGEVTDHFFLSAAKLADLGFTPAVGQEITIFYNRYGKVATIKLDDDIIIE